MPSYDPHIGWWGHLQPEQERDEERARVARDTAAALLVDPAEVVVLEVRQPTGIAFIGRWQP